MSDSKSLLPLNYNLRVFGPPLLANDMKKFIFTIMFLAIAVNAKAEDPIVGVYSNVTSSEIVILNKDSTFEYKYMSSFGDNKGQYVSQKGVYEKQKCAAAKYPDRDIGNYNFFQFNGATCCMDIREIGSKTSMKYIAGLDKYGICDGGVFSKQ